MKARRTRRLMLALALFGAGALAIASGAQAAAPAWRMLALTGPTNLPPEQSEVQRVTVEAEGGSFTMAAPKTVEGEGTFVTHFIGAAHITEGSNIASINFAISEPHVGDHIVAEAFPPGTTIVNITGSMPSPVLELSNPAARTNNFELIVTSSNEVTEVSTSMGRFHTGDEISADDLPAGTTVTAVDEEGGTITLSGFPSGGGPHALIGRERTEPLAFDAPAAAVLGAFDALPAFAEGAASIAVSGGPGGTAEHPYLLAFGGPLYAERDLEELAADQSGLAGQHASVHIFTTVPGGPGTGTLAIDPANVGGAPTSGSYTVTLGPLPPGIVTSGSARGTEWSCPGAAGESTVTCTSSKVVPRLTPGVNINVPIEVEPSLATTGSVPVKISGGGASPDSFQLPITISNQPAPPGTQAFFAGAFNEDGEEELRAGAHPYSAISYFMTNTVRATNGKVVPAADPKTVVVDLPPGFAGNPMVTQRCPQGQMTSGEAGSPACDREASSIGVFMPVLGGFGSSSQQFRPPIFNNVPPRGYAAEFTSQIAFPLQNLLASVRSSDDYGVRITAPNNPNYEKIYGAFAAIEGFPAGAHGKAFLRNGTACAETRREAPVVHTQFATWQDPDHFAGGASQNQVLPALTGCEKLHFHPGFTFQPTSATGSSPVGATAHLHLPQEGLEDPKRLSEADLKRAVVKLPAGLNLNPSSANGLQACSEDQIGLLTTSGRLPNPIRFDESTPSCPDGSKLGTVEVRTPMLEETVGGTIYLARQEENPFGSLIALYLVIESPRFGLTIKLPGEVRPDPATGQLTATFDYNPQLPFEDLTLHFRGGGPRSELATPEVCGRYETSGSWTPWSAPESGPPGQTTDGFTVSTGCAGSAASRPFSPSFEAGTSSAIAGAFAPLVIKVGRNDGEQELRRLEFSLPPGVSGKLAGVPYCSDAQIAVAAGKSGKAEQASPSCPAASRLGSVDTAAGVGSQPFHASGNVYLAGPYKGAPLSTVVITPAVAGPFDLGDVVVRAPIYLDPATAQLTAKSDPIPTILKGIPLKVRSVAISVDRPAFALNPTSCEVMAATASIVSSDGATARPANRFQVGDCPALKFAPKLNLRLKGGTKRNGHPALKAVLTYPAYSGTKRCPAQGRRARRHARGTRALRRQAERCLRDAPPREANISRVSVALPHSEFLEQGHIRTICTRVQFAAHQCPKGAIYGHAEAWSPLLSYKLSGPVFLRSSSHKLPDLVAVLRGPAWQPIEIELDGRIDSVHAGIRTTFEVVPDAPVSRFVLRMQGGKKGLLVNSTNICRGKHRATVKMRGQNGKRHDFKSRLRARCRRMAGKRDRHHGKGHKRRGD